MTKQKLLIVSSCFAGLCALVGCASDVIVFYPKASAKKAADNVINDIFSAPREAAVLSEPATNGTPKK